EAAELRAGGIAAPVLVMGALSEEELRVALEAEADVGAWSEQVVDSVRRAGGAVGGGGAAVRVHVKLDTGMGRLGTRDPEEAIRVAEAVAAATPALELVGAMTHFSSADEDPSYTADQLARFAPFVLAVRERWPGIAVHAANSAATLREPES